jgi:hypothetical protein
MTGWRLASLLQLSHWLFYSQRELRKGGALERPMLNSVVQSGHKKIKVLFSHENKRIHSALVPVLSDFLSHELGQEVEVISRYTAWETLYAATDNVFDLVILADTYRAHDLSAKELVKQIKKLDQSISVVQFASQEQSPTKLPDGYLKLPTTRQELRSLTHFFRGAEALRRRDKSAKFGWVGP